MPVLTNPKWELFAQELAKGKTADEAFNVSGMDRRLCGVHAGYYVYALIDPRNDSVFYIGKGKGRRFLAHYREWLAGKIINGKKYARIADIAAAGLKPVAVCLVEGLSESSALSLERGFIRGIGKEALSNYSSGRFSALEKADAEAKEFLMRLKPFSRWVKEKEAAQDWSVSPEHDKATYWLIVNGFIRCHNAYVAKLSA